jgi:hypothetical protein
MPRASLAGCGLQQVYFRFSKQPEGKLEEFFNYWGAKRGEKSHEVLNLHLELETSFYQVNLPSTLKSSLLP